MSPEGQPVVTMPNKPAVVDLARPSASPPAEEPHEAPIPYDSDTQPQQSGPAKDIKAEDIKELAERAIEIKKTPPTEAETTAALQLAWDGPGGTINLLGAIQTEGGYDISEAVMKKFARENNCDIGSELVLEERERRKSVNDALDIVKKAKSGKPVDNSPGVFEIDISDGKTERIRVQQAVKPITDELNRLSQEKNPSEEGKSPEPTTRAKQAEQLYKILEPRLVKYSGPNGEEYFFDTTPGLEKQKALELKEAEALTYDLTIDVLEEGHFSITDEDGHVILQREQNTKKVNAGNEVTEEVVSINPEADLDKLKPNDSQARLTLLVAQYVRDGQTLEAKKSLVALMHMELVDMDAAQLASNPTLSAELKAFQNNSVYQTHFNETLSELDEIIVVQAGYDPNKVKLDPKTRKYRLRTLITARVCEGKIKQNSAGRPELPTEVKSSIREWISDGTADQNEEALILNLADESAASTILSKNLGFDLDELSSESAVHEQVKRGAVAINNRRTERGQPKWNESSLNNWTKVAEKNIEKSLIKIKKMKGKFNPMWLLGLAMGVPMIAPVLESGKEADEQTR